MLVYNDIIMIYIYTRMLVYNDIIIYIHVGIILYQQPQMLMVILILIFVVVNVKNLMIY